jgi:hypothetical protein
MSKRIPSIEKLILDVGSLDGVNPKIYGHFELLFPASKGIMAIEEKAIVCSLKEVLGKTAFEAEQKSAEISSKYTKLKDLREVFLASISPDKHIQINLINRTKWMVDQLITIPIEDVKFCFRIFNHARLVNKMINRLDYLYPGIQDSNEKL